MVVVLLGAPGSGKGTQAKNLIQRLGIPQLSTGDMLRAAVNSVSDVGKQAAEYLQRGALVPDSLVLSLIEERLGGQDCKDGFILDGFPRNIAQADALEALLTRLGKKISHVLAIDVDEKELIQRLSGRRICKKCGTGFHVAYQPPQVAGKCDQCGGDLYQRSDDNENVISERLKVYRAQTAPLLDYYRHRNVLREMRGVGSPGDITDRIMQVLKA
ncbi:MAG: adenylate kinase [Deltaproteobacteria bacterium]|nr:adenylate kinase [Deltaproteobacteria bacterium]